MMITAFKSSQTTQEGWFSKVVVVSIIILKQLFQWLFIFVIGI